MTESWEKTCVNCKKWGKPVKQYIKGAYVDVALCQEWSIHYVSGMSCARWEEKT